MIRFFAVESTGVLTFMMSAQKLLEAVVDARQRTLELVADLTDEQLIGPSLPIVNPLLWEIGHVAWFQEKWVLRHQGRRNPLRPDGDALYDSATVPHDTRWDLWLPDRKKTIAYMLQIHDQVIEHLRRSKDSPEDIYFVRLSIFHEDMHNEAMTYTRQTLGYPPPPGRLVLNGTIPIPEGASLAEDTYVPGQRFLLGAHPHEDFVFDNEKWAHAVEVKPFHIARAPVTQENYKAFVEAGGYQRKEFWSPKGWRWRASVNAQHPIYWQKENSGNWWRREFDRWLPLEPHRPMIHVNWYEAEAYGAYAGRRLPTEVEWEVAAATEGDSAPGEGFQIKRRYPWGETPPNGGTANLGGLNIGCVDVGAFPESDSAWGCRQMIGNVWEWTDSDFLPFPGFVVDPYKEYSQPWFGTHKVLRGGSWATPGRLIRNTWRNFYTPDRQDILAGFRTCALD